MSNIQLHSNSLPVAADQFALKYSPKQCLRLFNTHNSAAKCLDSNTPTLAGIRKQYSDDFIIAYIALWIDNLNDFVNASRKMNPAQIEETATIVYQEFYYFNIADINLVFRKIKKGEFGQLFSELDGVKILAWFEKYAAERAHTAAEMSQHNTDYFGKDIPRKNNDIEKIKNKQAMGLLTLLKANCSF